MSRTRIRGSSEPIGSWKTICSRVAQERRAVARGDGRDVAGRRTSTVPDVGASSPASSRSSVDFPEPDSPTMPNRSPGRDLERRRRAARAPRPACRTATCASRGRRGEAGPARRSAAHGMRIPTGWRQANRSSGPTRVGDAVAGRPVRLDRALLRRARAAVAEDAARRELPGSRDAARDRRSRLTAASTAPGRRRRADRRCSGWRGAREHLPRPVPASTIRPPYMTSTRSQSDGDDGQVVRDEQQRGVRASAARSDQVEHLRLHGDVERGRRLVADQQVRVVGEAIAITTRCRCPPESWCG